MSNIRIFYPEKLSINLETNLDKSQSYYLLKVMRIKRGDTISVFNKSGEWKSIITETIKSIVYFKVTEQLRQKEIEQEMWLAFSPIKSNYFNFMIQKATELGVTKFLPIISERTIVRKINNERLNKIIIESCEQSNRINVPSIEKSQSLEKFLSVNLDINLIFGDLNTKNKKIKFYNSKPNCLLIGPEGDYSSNEIKKILNYKGAQSIKLSDNILRSETAVISALSVINYLLN
ncbi:16S rRNA (uracil(1498)-N(3))-methyltransferase [Candidatus Pelagibacter sp.]|nr:16S rRNA (uracil(1498)-N(3))-methyltransferase [Candidatus Pelagibacter sp.]